MSSTSDDKREPDDFDLPEFTPPAVVYHYCSNAAFHGIGTSRSLWLTGSTSSNDKAEHTWAHRIVEEELTRVNKPELTDFFNEMTTAQRQPVLNPTIFMTSFSAHGDLLSQWRGYADDGRGVALGFSTSAFGLGIGAPMPSTEAEETVKIGNVIYDPDLQRRLIRECIEYHVELVQKDAPPHGAAIACTHYLRKLTFLCKNQAFAEEAEARIMYSPLVKYGGAVPRVVAGKLESLAFLARRSGLVPKFALSLSSDPAKNPIVDVVLGPANESRLGDIELFLDLCRFHGAVVRRSSATYRTH